MKLKIDKPGADKQTATDIMITIPVILLGGGVKIAVSPVKKNLAWNIGKKYLFSQKS